MRRTITLAVVAAVALAACGSDDDTATADAGGTAAADLAAASDVPSDAADADATADATDPDGSNAADDSTPDADPSTTAGDKPSVDVPDELPTTLGRTVIVKGEGDPAAPGDTVIVDYGGVRTRDGVEFDNSYDRGEPFPVTLGAGGVIEGWDQGLVGSRVGERLQLDIPGDLAYGDQAPGDLIGENEALTFVIDVHAIVPKTDPADEPTEAGVSASEGATEVTTVDLREGDGPELEVGDTAILHLVLFRGDNLAGIDTTWSGDPIQVPMADGTFPVLLEGMPGMKVGGRRAIVAPGVDVFGPEGNPQLGLPAGTDAIFVIDLLGTY
jgi:FKBP-type peptidyl-prolyl cis-trans isomerase